MEGHICFKKKRTLSMETLDPRISNEYDQLLNNFNNITIDKNTQLLEQIIQRLNKLESKIDKIFNEKDAVHKLEKKIDKIFTEKDYTIDALKDELYYFKDELKDLKNNTNNNKNNDYFC